MLGSINPIANITSAYSDTTRQLSSALARIASGKKFQNASEDLIGFLKAQKLKVNISGYEQVRQDLTSFKAYTSAAVQASSSVYEALTEMKDLAEKYTGASADLQAEYAAEFNSLQTQVSSMITNTKVDGDSIIAAGSVKTVAIDPEGTTLDMNFTAANTTAIVDAFDLATNGGAATATAVQGEIDTTLTYMSEAKSYDAIADQQIKLTDTIINSKQASLSLITDIDEAEEMKKVLDLTLRQQAGVAMMAQANMVQNSMSKLYE